MLKKDVGGQFGAAALQMLQTMPPWTPGEVAGRKVLARYLLPIIIEFK